MLSIKCQSFYAKYDTFVLFLNDENTKHKILVICVYYTGHHKGTDTNCSLLSHYTLINANRRLIAHGMHITNAHNDVANKVTNITL